MLIFKRRKTVIFLIFGSAEIVNVHLLSPTLRFVQTPPSSPLWIFFDISAPRVLPQENRAENAATPDFLGELTYSFCRFTNKRSNKCSGKEELIVLTRSKQPTQNIMFAVAFATSVFHYRANCEAWGHITTSQRTCFWRFISEGCLLHVLLRTGLIRERASWLKSFDTRKWHIFAS